MVRTTRGHKATSPKHCQQASMRKLGSMSVLNCKVFDSQFLILVPRGLWKPTLSTNSFGKAVTAPSK